MTSAHRQALFAAIFARDGGRCVHCGRPVRPRARGLHRAPDLATLDHLTPRSAGGRTVIENLALACQACNNARGSLSLEAFRATRGRAGEGG
ncbi:MAG TPA: HNH endonuclease signature motif containing protein [Microvirga sp.]|jgi:5-methylcytosine-specific restriction endonuclease McrA|nr:HNH endonuclease signature motif containing protein [Microvirga sp.]